MEPKQNVTKNGISGPINYMEMDEFNNKHIISLLNEAKNIAIMPSKIAGPDSFFASIGLYHMLKELLENKGTQIQFIYSGKIPDQCIGAIDEKDIVTNIAERELVISVDYSNTDAGKVQYSTENEILHLRIGPVPKSFETSRIKAKITGFDFDLIFVVGAQELADLGQIYSNLRQEINSANKIVLDNTNRNKRFGLVNIVDDSADTLSTLVFKNAAAWNLIPNKKSAEALLKGITYRDKSTV